MVSPQRQEQHSVKGAREKLAHDAATGFKTPIELAKNSWMTFETADLVFRWIGDGFRAKGRTTYGTDSAGGRDRTDGARRLAEGVAEHIRRIVDAV